MLKTTGLFKKSALKALKVYINKVVKSIDSDRVDEIVKNLSLSKKSKMNIKAMENLNS